MESTDKVERLVSRAITATQSGSKLKILWAFAAMGSLNTQEVVAEIFLQIDEATKGVDDKELFEVITIPLPPNSTELLAAIRNRNLFELQEAVGSGSLEKTFASLIVLTASLKDARTRL